MADSHQPPIDVHQLLEEFLDRQQRGEHPRVDGYCKKYPHLDAEIREVFEAVLLVERLKPHSQDEVAMAGETPATTRQPTSIGDYDIVREVGRGGMGVVYEAEQRTLGRRVAIKVLPQGFTSTKELKVRFQREARSAAKLHHTNIVPVFDVGTDADCLYYTMQLIRGQSLDSIIEDLRNLRNDSNEPSKSDSDAVAARKKSDIVQSLVTGVFRDNRHVPDQASGEIQPVQIDADSAATASDWLGDGASETSSSWRQRSQYYHRVAGIGIQVASALGYAHDRGTIHRDIKPSNLILDLTGVTWVTDFGLAKTNDSDLTQTGDILGTVRYMSPERFSGTCDEAADIYALGITLYELLALSPAFTASSREHLIELIAHREPKSIRAYDNKVPRDLETIVLKAIDKDLKRRYQSANELGADLQRFVNDEPIHARRISTGEQVVRWGRRNRALATALASVVLLLVLIAAFATHSASRMQARVQEIAQDSYATEVAAANEAYRSGSSRSNLAHRLEELIPAEGEADRREFSWRHLWYQLHSRTTSATLEGIPSQLAWNGTSVLAVVTDKPDHNEVLHLQSIWHRATPRPRIVRWDPLGQYPNVTHVFSPNEEVDALALSPDGSRVAFITRDREQERGNLGLLQSVDLGSGDVEWTANFPYGRSCISYSADGKLLMVLGQDGIVRIIRADNGSLELQSHILRQKIELPDKLDDMRDFELLWDGTKAILANYPYNGQAAVRNLAAAVDLRVPCDRIISEAGNVEPTVKFAASGGNVSAWAGYSGKVGVWLHETDELFRLDEGSPAPSCLAVSWDGKLLGLGQADGTVAVWDLVHRRLATTLQTHQSMVIAASFSRDGKSITASDLEGTLSVTRLADEEPFYANEYGQRALSLSASRKGILAIATRQRYADNPVSLYDQKSSRWLPMLRGEGEIATEVCFSPDGNELAVGVVSAPTFDAELRLFETETWRPTKTLRIPKDHHLYQSVGNKNLVGKAVGSVEYSPDQRWIVAGFGMRTMRGPDYNQIVAVWSSESGELEVILSGHQNSIPGIAFPRDGSWMATACRDGRLRIFDTQTWKQTKEIAFNENSRLGALAVSPDGAFLALGDDDGDVILCSFDGEVITRLQGHARGVSTLTFGRNWRTLASGAWDGTTRVWDMLSRRQTMTLQSNGGFVYDLAFDEHGETLFEATHDGVVNSYYAPPLDKIDEERSKALARTAFDRKPGKPVDTDPARQIVDYPPLSFGSERSAPNSTRAMPYYVLGTGNPVFSGDGRRLYAVSNVEPLAGESVYCWDLDAASIVDHVEVGAAIERIAVSNDESLLLAASTDSEIFAVEIKSKRKLWSMPLERQDGEHAVHSLALSPDNQIVVAATAAGDVSFLETQSGRLLRSYRISGGHLAKTSFSEDGRWLLIGDKTSTIIDTNTFDVVTPFPAGTCVTASFAIGDKIVSAEEDGRTTVWSWNGNEVAEETSWPTLERHQGENLLDRPSKVTDLVVSADGTQVALFYNENMMEVWDIHQQKVSVSVVGAKRRVQGDFGPSSFHPTKRWLAVEAPEGIRFIATEQHKRLQLDGAWLDRLSGAYKFSVPGRGQYLLVERSGDHLLVSRPGLGKPTAIYPRSKFVFSPEIPELQSQRYTFLQDVSGTITHVVVQERDGFVSKAPRVKR